MNIYNDENIFFSKRENIEEKLNGFIQIPIYWSKCDGYFELDIESMTEEFERTVYGIESVLEEVQDDEQEMIEAGAYIDKQLSVLRFNSNKEFFITMHQRAVERGEDITLEDFVKKFNNLFN